MKKDDLKKIEDSNFLDDEALKKYKDDRAKLIKDIEITQKEEKKIDLNEIKNNINKLGLFKI